MSRVKIAALALTLSLGLAGAAQAEWPDKPSEITRMGRIAKASGATVD